VGVGFAGGRWVGNSFAYNRAVTNINVTVIHNSYHETVVNNVTVNRVSYNGGPGGTRYEPSAQERAVASEQHVPPTQMQRQHFQESARNPGLAARANGGHPAIAATPRPAAFNAPGVVGAHGAAPLSSGSAGRGPGQPGQFNQQNGAARAPGQTGQFNPQNGAAHAPGQPGQPGQVNGAAHTPGQPGQAGQPNNFVRTPGQPQGTKAQGQPGQPGTAKPPKQQPKPQRAKPEEKKGEHEK
jgi:hypothetical protein